MSDDSTNPTKKQLYPVPVTGGQAEPARVNVCAVCGQPAKVSAFLADAGQLHLCHVCFGLFGFGGKDGPK